MDAPESAAPLRQRAKGKGRKGEGKGTKGGDQGRGPREGTKGTPIHWESQGESIHPMGVLLLLPAMLLPAMKKILELLDLDREQLGLLESLSRSP